MARDYQNMFPSGSGGKQPLSQQDLKNKLRVARTLGLRMGEEGPEEGDQNTKSLKTAEEDDLNYRIRAGFAFLGQFVGHDITHDSELNIKPEDDSNTSRNLGTPTLDLNGLY